MTARRHFLKQLITVLMGVAGITGCQDDIEEGTGVNKPELGGIDRATLDAVVDAFVPRDQDPGAVEAGITDILLDLFNKNAEMKQQGKTMLARVEVVAQHKFRKSFHYLSLARREVIIHKILRSRREDDQPARHAISALRGHVIEAFYLSPTGQAMLGYYPPYPDGYPDYHAPPAS